MTILVQAVPDIRELVAAAIARTTDGPKICADGHSYDASCLKALHDALVTVLTKARVPLSAPIALVARSRAVHVAAFAALVAARRTTVMIYGSQSASALAADISAAACAAIIAAEDDWSDIALDAACGTGAVAIQVDGTPDRGLCLFRTGSATAPSGWRERDRATGFEILSSGTTGAAKRVPISWATMSAAVAEAAESYVGSAERKAPTLFLHPLGSIAGPAYLLPALAASQPIAVLERFTVATWVAAVRQHRPFRASLPPAALAMVLADPAVRRDDLASLTLVAVGGGALPADQQQGFESRFGVPVLPAFGATEFCGVIANWSLEDYRRFAAVKQGSAGRASRHVALRVVDQTTGATLPTGEVGRLEARVDRLGPDWVATTDLATLDADGFLYLRGRADGAINRGGFKILPEKVANVLRGHAAVADAVVVPRLDRRLGAVPVAVIEPRAGASVTPADVLMFARDRLLAHEVPVEVRILDALPRTESMKVALAEVMKLIGD